MPGLESILIAASWAVLTGLFNLIFANKSQINSWALSNPRLAAFFKLTRSIGFDPQHFWAFVTLLVKKTLPKVQLEENHEEHVPVSVAQWLRSIGCRWADR